MKLRSFDTIAGIYDRWVQIVFGDNLWTAQYLHCERIRKGDKVLILGGGTGKILDHIPRQATVHYLDVSEGMLKRACQRRDAHFIHVDFLSWQPADNYDWIICPFFLDCFDQRALFEVIEKIQKSLREKGYLLVTDFQQNQSKWFDFQLWLMHWFFRVMAGISAKRLLPIHDLLLERGWTCVDKKYKLSKKVFSALYQKTD